MRAAVAIGTGLIAALFATTLAAEAPTRSLIPKPRPGGQAAQQAPAVVNDPIANLVNNILKPRPRPGANTQVQQMTAAGTGSYTRLAVARSLVPKPRPQNLVRRNTVQRTGMAQSGDDARRVTRAGSVCGRPEIKGVKLQSIPGRVNGCGVSEPVKVTSVSGVALSQPITVDCQTAVVFNAWVGQALVPLTKRLGGGVQEVTIFASYACRTRNNQRGAKISEHGRGHAVDVGGFTLANGVELTVLDHWNDPQHGSLMQQLHRVACGPFGTVLGPKSDRFHKNHFHFDTARYRSGSYCR